MLVELHSSGGRGCIYSHFCKAGPLTVTTAFDLLLPLKEPGVVLGTSDSNCEQTLPHPLGVLGFLCLCQEGGFTFWAKWHRPQWPKSRGVRTDWGGRGAQWAVRRVLATWGSPGARVLCPQVSWPCSTTDSEGRAEASELFQDSWKRGSFRVTPEAVGGNTRPVTGALKEEGPMGLRTCKPPPRTGKWTVHRRLSPETPVGTCRSTAGSRLCNPGPVPMSEFQLPHQQRGPYDT